MQENIFENKIVKEISEVKCRSFRRKFQKEISEVKLYFGSLVLTALKCYCLDNGHRTRQHDGAKNNFDETIITIFFQLQNGVKGIHRRSTNNIHTLSPLRISREEKTK